MAATAVCPPFFASAIPILIGKNTFANFFHSFPPYYINNLFIFARIFDETENTNVFL